MLKKTITYVDFDGNKTKGDFYFNLTKSELAELEVSLPGGFDGIRKSITDTLAEGRTIVGALLDAYKILIAKAVGTKTADGKHFIKPADFREAFLASDAYSELVIELMNSDNEDAIVEFFDKIIVGSPVSIKEAAEKAKEDTTKVVAIAELKDDESAVEPVPSIPELTI